MKQTLDKLIEHPNLTTIIPTKNYSKIIRDLKTLFAGYLGGKYKCEYNLIPNVEKQYCKVMMNGKLRIVVKVV